METHGPDQPTLQEEGSEQEVQAVAEETGRLLRIRRLAKAGGEKASAAAGKVVDIAKQGGGGVKHTTQRGLETVADTAQAVIDTAKATPGAIAHTTAEAAHTATHVAGSSAHKVTEVGSTVVTAPIAAARAAGEIASNVSSDPEARAAGRTLRREGPGLIIKLVETVAQSDKVPDRARETVKKHGGKAEKASEILKRLDEKEPKQPTGDTTLPEETQPRRVDKLAETVADVALPKQAALVKSGVRTARALGTLGKVVAREVREYRENPNIKQALQAFGEQPPAPPAPTNGPKK